MMMMMMMMKKKKKKKKRKIYSGSCYAITMNKHGLFSCNYIFFIWIFVVI